MTGHYRRFELADAIRQEVISGLHRGLLEPGSRLTGTRDIANRFDVSPRTAMAAYRILEAEGFIELRERSGAFVAQGSPNAPMLTQLAGWVVEILLQARVRDIPPAEFPERIRRCVETLRLHAGCIAGNADQADEICHEMKNDYGISSENIEPELMQMDASDAQRRLSKFDLFVATAAHATATNAMARALGKPALTVTLRRDLMSEMARNLAKGPVYIIGSDPRFRDALSTVFDPTEGGHNVHPVILGEDDPDEIPETAVVYVMRSAYDRLPDSPLRRRIAPVPRVFSRDMARNLLGLIVRANMTALKLQKNPAGSSAGFFF